MGINIFVSHTTRFDHQVVFRGGNMRTWIWIAGLTIAETINPGHIFNLAFSVSLIVLGIMGMIMDLLEFKTRVS